jgi:hypothetical protein
MRFSCTGGRSTLSIFTITHSPLLSFVHHSPCIEKLDQVAAPDSDVGRMDMSSCATTTASIVTWSSSRPLHRELFEGSLSFIIIIYHHHYASIGLFPLTRRHVIKSRRHHDEKDELRCRDKRYYFHTNAVAWMRSVAWVIDSWICIDKSNNDHTDDDISLEQRYCWSWC